MDVLTVQLFIAGDVVTGADIAKVAIKLRKQNAKAISEDVILVSLTTLSLVISEIIRLDTGWMLTNTLQMVQAPQWWTGKLQAY